MKQLSMAEGSVVETLPFVSIILKWLEQCLKSTLTFYKTVTDTVHILADGETPRVRIQTGVPLFYNQSGIEHLAGEQATLKAHIRAQLTLVVRYYARWFDTTHADAVRAESRRLEHVHRRQSGSCALTFVPPRPCVMHLMLFFDGKLLEECMVRNIRLCCESTSFDHTTACITDVRSVPTVSPREPVRVCCPVTTEIVATETKAISGSVIGRVAEFFRVSLCI
uniref:Uncharacterized protein n=1 Tax=Anopheles arabiensis TaxID=7173 RepID=A0A182HXX5_ANOAR